MSSAGQAAPVLPETDKAGPVDKSAEVKSQRSVVRIRPRVLTREVIGPAACPEFERWTLYCHWFAIRLHRWFRDDRDDYFHDHPWSFVTLVLRGGYLDWTPTGLEPLQRGAIRYRPATHKHTVCEVQPGTLTLCITTPKRRRYAFYPMARLSKRIWANKFFLEHQRGCD